MSAQARLVDRRGHRARPAPTPAGPVAVSWSCPLRSADPPSGPVPSARSRRRLPGASREAVRPRLPTGVITAPHGAGSCPHLGLHPPETGVCKVGGLGHREPPARLDPFASSVWGLEYVTLRLQASVSLSVKMESRYSRNRVSESAR